MDETPISNGKNFREPPLKKIPKKRAHSVSSGHKSFVILTEEFSQLFGLDLIKENFKKMVFDEYENKVLSADLARIKTEGLLRLRIRDILSPLISLDKTLCNKRDSHKLKRALELMFGLPFTISQIAGEFDPNDRRESKSIAQYLRYLARALEKGGLLKSGWVFDEEWGLPEDTVLFNTQFFYVSHYHSIGDIREFVMKEYTDYAKNIGRRKIRTEVEEIIIEKKQPKITDFTPPEPIKPHVPSDRIKKMLAMDKENKKKEQYERSD